MENRCLLLSGLCNIVCHKTIHVYWFVGNLQISIWFYSLFEAIIIVYCVKLQTKVDWFWNGNICLTPEISAAFCTSRRQQICSNVLFIILETIWDEIGTSCAPLMNTNFSNATFLIFRAINYYIEAYTCIYICITHIHVWLHKMHHKNCGCQVIMQWYNN